MIKIRKGIWETSSSSASPLVMLSGGEKQPPRLTKTFKCVQGLYDTECDGRPHIYLSNWMDKMAYLAEDTELWHKMFKKATGQDFEYWVSMDFSPEDIQVIKNKGYACEYYPQPAIESKWLQDSPNSFYRSESLYREPEWGYICGYDIDYRVTENTVLVKQLDLPAILSLVKPLGDTLINMVEHRPLHYLLRDEFKDMIANTEFLTEIVFNPGFAINIGGDCFFGDTQTVPPTNSPDGIAIQRRGFSILDSLYQNGTEYVLLARDGTKMRIADEYSEPYYPESIDLKITDYCDEGCPFCYEGCTPQGSHGTLAACLKDIPEFIELAVGGGNALAHPDYSLLTQMTKYVNTTLHANEFSRLFWQSELGDGERYDFWYELFPEMEISRCRALGVSVTSIEDAHKVIEVYKSNLGYLNHGDSYEPSSILGSSDFYIDDCGMDLRWGIDTVIHVINGVVTEEILKPLYDMNLKLLILGYKNKGRGVQYASNSYLAENQKWLYDNITEVAKHFKTVAFDTLAIEQLDMKRWLSKEQWDRNYMGDDGLHSMYIDLVSQTYGISSTDSRRWPLTDNLHEMFMHVREVVKQASNTGKTSVFS